MRNVLLVVLGLLVLGGCGAAKRDPMQAGRPVQGYHPERFPDIPLPPGYSLDPAHDQLAVAVGDGLVRRYEVFLLQRPDAKSPAGSELLAYFDRQLTSLGWAPSRADDRSRTFRKQYSELLGEELTVLARGKAASFHLRPWTPGTP